MEPSSKPEFPIERPAHFDETKRGTWDELTVLDIVEQGMGSLTYSKNAMEIWPTNADVGDVNAWGADGNKEVTEQVLNVIARVIEVRANFPRCKTSANPCNRDSENSRKRVDWRISVSMIQLGK